MEVDIVVQRTGHFTFDDEEMALLDNILTKYEQDKKLAPEGTEYFAGETNLIRELLRGLRMEG